MMAAAAPLACALRAWCFFSSSPVPHSNLPPLAASSQRAHKIKEVASIHSFLAEIQDGPGFRPLKQKRSFQGAKTILDAVVVANMPIQCGCEWRRPFAMTNCSNVPMTEEQVGHLPCRRLDPQFGTPASELWFCASGNDPPRTQQQVLYAGKKPSMPEKVRWQNLLASQNQSEETRRPQQKEEQSCIPPGKVALKTAQV